ncbi:MAG: hypothetical protein OEM62_04935 [Acidobacteriota bacterium]|nr:hypothetical protein [Acidobacteriota bacterium]
MKRNVWWGEYELEIGDSGHWEIGSLGLWMEREASEWKMAYSWNDDEDPELWTYRRNESFPDAGVQGERFAVQRTGGTVKLRAVTADRSVVARPRTPFRVPSGHQTRILVSSPLWVEIAVGPEPAYLRELPAKRLSETWFGSTTRDGELAYALKTNARTRLEDLPMRPYRFVTPIVIENEGPDTLFVERLNLPVPHLSIFGAGEALWSEEVRMLRSEVGDVAELDVRSGPPQEAKKAALLSEPRLAFEKGHLFRAFSSLLRL